METKLTPIVVNRAVEIYSTTPNIHHKDVAEELGISNKTLLKLRKDADFWKKVYDTYMISYEGEIVDVVRAMLREAKAGNVQAGRLVMEHSGKLQQHLNVNISSPFEKWLMQNNHKKLDKVNIEDAEIVEMPQVVADEFKANDKKLIQKKSQLEKRRQNYSWFRRAEAVGIAPLPPCRPTKGQRMEWEMSIIRAEEEQSNTNAES